jgi:SAM-dependent methyltransferase
MHLRYRQSCRACGATSLRKVIDLGEQFIQGVFVKEGVQQPPMRRIPLELVRCDPTQDQNACGLLQTSVSVPPEILYSTYWYRSGTNQTMRTHLHGIAEEGVSLLDKSGRSDLRVLDIGCNDGTLLAAYPTATIKFGIDPSNATDAIGPDVTVIHDRFPSAELAAKADVPFDLITSIAMFYDLEDPVGFVTAVKQLLRADGVWIFEMSYMPEMLRSTSYDTICHEHLEYYSLAVLEMLLARAEMRLFKVALNDINGGSIRCYATHAGNFQFRSDKDLNYIEEVRRKEFDMSLDTDRPYRDFQESAERHRESLTRLVKDLKRSGKRIHVYGASTKGNVILQFCGIDSSLIDFAADRNPDKYGARTLGTDIPIISEQESRALKPDFYLVLPWHFRKEFLERERATLERGTKFIFPLPEIEVVGA